MISIETKLTAQLHAFAARRGVKFTDHEAAGIAAIRMRVDEDRERTRANSVTTIAVGELLQPDSPYLLLRCDFTAWLVPDMPNGWEEREPWLGGLNAVRWIGGPPAVAAFRRVGAPV